MNIVLFNIYENKTKEQFEDNTNQKTKGSILRSVYSGFRCLLKISNF